MTAIVCVSQSWGIGREAARCCSASLPTTSVSAPSPSARPSSSATRPSTPSPGGKPLKDRRNIVLSHRDLDVPGAEIAHSFDAAAALGGDDAIVIGGASVYMALLSRCDRVYVTKVDADPDADSFFPNLDDNPDWRIESESETFEENGLKFRYVDYVRK